MQKIEVLEWNDQDITKEELEKLLNGTESDFLDFKQQWHADNQDLVHDIVCMANSLSYEKHRYLVIGIDDKGKLYGKIKNDPNRKTQDNIYKMLSEYLELSPNIKVLSLDVKYSYGKKVYKIDFLSITPAHRHLPYFITKFFTTVNLLNEGEQKKEEKEIKLPRECSFLGIYTEDGKAKKVCCNSEGKLEYVELDFEGVVKKAEKSNIKLIKGAVYLRYGSTNTPKDQSASPAQVDELFARKRGEHLSVGERFLLYLDDIESWHLKYDDEDVVYLYKKDNNFKIVLYGKLMDPSRTQKRAFKNADTDGIFNYTDALEANLSREVWKEKRDLAKCNEEDNIRHWDAELFHNKEPFGDFSGVHLHFRYLSLGKKNYHRVGFYTPYFVDMNITCQEFSDEQVKEYIKSTLEYKACRLFYFCEGRHDDYPEHMQHKHGNDESFEFLNYDYIRKSEEYAMKFREEGRLCNGQPC